MIKLLVKSFWEMAVDNGQSFLSSGQDALYKRALTIIHLFYLMVFLFSVQTFSPFTQFPEWNLLLDSEHLFSPLWGVVWIRSLEWGVAVRGILLFFFTSSILGVLFFQRSLVVRFLVFLSVFLYVSLISSFGKIDHFMHFVIVASFLFIFLPSSKAKSIKGSTLKVFFGVQTFILVAYFLSGSFKVLGAVKQVLSGSASAFSNDSLAINLSKTMMAFDFDYFFTDFLLSHFSYFFSILLVLGYLVELLAVYFLFKRKYHRLYGVVLLLFHAGILLTVGADFIAQMLIVALFFVFSPFADSQGDLSADLRKLFSFAKSFFSKKEVVETVIYYDGDCITCNKFLVELSKCELPDTLFISSQTSEGYNYLIERHPDLLNVDSIVVTQKTKSNSTIRIKADAITYLLDDVKRFSIYRIMYLLAPYVANVFYDIRAKTRKKSAAGVCIIPPDSLASRLRY
jgi:predicted DCC family thiol-disulfide oxidoreductase YuxK